MYSPSFSFVAIAAIIPLLYFVIFLAYNSSISTIIVGMRVGGYQFKKVRVKVKVKDYIYILYSR